MFFLFWKSLSIRETRRRPPRVEAFEQCARQRYDSTIIPANSRQPTKTTCVQHAMERLLSTAAIELVSFITW